MDAKIISLEIVRQKLETRKKVAFCYELDRFIVRLNNGLERRLKPDSITGFYCYEYLPDSGKQELELYYDEFLQEINKLLCQFGWEFLPKSYFRASSSYAETAASPFVIYFKPKTVPSDATT
jgi:hypothetical protein